MRIRLLTALALVAVGAFLLCPLDSQSQQPFGRSFGGGSFDPDRYFDSLASGGSTIKIDHLPGRDAAREWATKNGITNGEMNRDQYKAYMQERLKSGGSGGFSGGSFNPEDLFNRYSKDGKTVRFDATRDPSRAQKWAADNGIKTDSFTKEQWLEYAKSWSSGGRSSSTPGQPATTSTDKKDDKSTATPSTTTQQSTSGGSRWGDRGFDVNRVDDYFRRWDRNGNGFLEFEEMSETLQAEKDNWDANKDGLIDGTEFRDYMKAWHEKRQAERGEGSSSGSRSSSPDPMPGTLPPGTHGGDAPAVDLDKKVLVLRAGKLGDKMPAWFADYDTDKDAQIALYEWKEKDGELSKFREWDANEDGFITPDEVVRLSALASAKETPSSSSSEKGTSSATRAPTTPGGSSSGSSRGSWLSGMFGRRDSGQSGNSIGSSRGGPPGMGSGIPGMGGGSMSDMLFERVAKGRSSFNLSEADSRMKESLTEFAKKKGITDGTITKEVFKEYWASRESERGDRGSSDGMRRFGGRR